MRGVIVSENSLASAANACQKRRETETQLTVSPLPIIIITGVGSPQLHLRQQRPRTSAFSEAKSDFEGEAVPRAFRRWKYLNPPG